MFHSYAIFNFKYSLESSWLLCYMQFFLNIQLFACSYLCSSCCLFSSQFLSPPVGHDQPYKIKHKEKWYKYRQLHCATSTQIEKNLQTKMHSWFLYLHFTQDSVTRSLSLVISTCMLQERCMSNVYKLCTLQWYMQPARGLYYFNLKRLFTERFKQTLELCCDWLMS